jgi:hypothetical protein
MLVLLVLPIMLDLEQLEEIHMSITQTHSIKLVQEQSAILLEDKQVESPSILEQDKLAYIPHLHQVLFLIAKRPLLYTSNKSNKSQPLLSTKPNFQSLHLKFIELKQPKQ